MHSRELPKCYAYKKKTKNLSPRNDKWLFSLHVETRVLHACSVDGVCNNINLYRTPWFISYMCYSVGNESEWAMECGSVIRKSVNSFDPSQLIRSLPSSKSVYVQVIHITWCQIEWCPTHTHAWHRWWIWCGNLRERVSQAGVHIRCSYLPTVVIAVSVSRYYLRRMRFDVCTGVVLNVDVANRGYVRHLSSSLPVLKTLLFRDALVFFRFLRWTGIECCLSGC